MRHVAHCLDHAAAQICEHCDGWRIVIELSDLLQTKQEYVGIALEQLESCHLLQVNTGKRSGIKKLSRRQLIKTAGIAALVAVPLISTIGKDRVQIQQLQALTNLSKHRCAQKGPHPLYDSRPRILE